tara:strand:- start:3316 stop:4545 length:1230 start_codon:yes stop_codon:yes gene_type:complete
LTDQKDTLTREERIAQLDAQLMDEINSFDPFESVSKVSSHTESFNTQIVHGHTNDNVTVHKTNMYNPDKMVEHNGQLGMWSDGDFFAYDPGEQDFAENKSPQQSVEEIKGFLATHGSYDAANDMGNAFGTITTSFVDALQDFLKNIQSTLGIELNGDWNAQTRAKVLNDSDVIGKLDADGAALGSAIIENFSDNMDNIQNAGLLNTSMEAGIELHAEDISTTPMVHMGGGGTQIQQTSTYDPENLVTHQGMQGYWSDGYFFEFSQELHDENLAIQDEMSVADIQSYLIENGIEPLASSMNEGTGIWTAETSQALKSFIQDKQGQSGLTQNGEWSPLLANQITKEAKILQDGGSSDDYEQGWKLENLSTGINRLIERGKFETLYDAEKTQLTNADTLSSRQNSANLGLDS